MIDNGKAKQAIVIGGILFSLGFILSGFVDNLPMLFLTYGVIAGSLGSGLAFTGNLNNILKFFPDRRGLASGIVLAGVGVGTLLCTRLAEYFMAQTHDVSRALLYLGIVYLVVIFIVQFFSRSAPAKDSGGIKASPLVKDYRHMLKDGICPVHEGCAPMGNACHHRGKYRHLFVWLDSAAPAGCWCPLERWRAGAGILGR